MAKSSGGWLKIAILSVLLAANTAIFWFSYQSVSQSKQQYEVLAETHTSNVAEAIEENIQTGFEKLDLVLRSVAEEYRRQQAANRLNLGSIQDYIERIRKPLPQINLVILTDALGNVRLNNGVAAPPLINVSDRE